MSQTELLTESRPHTTELTQHDAVALSQLGRRLASSKEWWGDDGTTDATVIRLRPDGADRWEVRVADAVGAVAIGETTFVVQPKIPEAHLLYLFGLSGAFPRLDPQRAAIASGASLWELVAGWFADAAEAVLRRDLVRDYRSHQEPLSIARGHIRPLPTTTALLNGRLELHCEYDEFDADNAYNRILLAAAQRVGASTLLQGDIRRRARRIALRLDGIGPLQAGDLRVSFDRRTWYYRDAIALGRSILAGQGRSLQAGKEAAWTFLIRTPEMVEAGVRSILADALAPDHVVTKKGLRLEGSTRTLNPDLVFDYGDAIGDVKYKLTGSDWTTSDLYQSVAFATGYRSTKAVVIGFSDTGRTLPVLQVGDVRVTYLAWNASQHIDPTNAAEQLVDQVRDWLQT